MPLSTYPILGKTEYFQIKDVTTLLNCMAAKYNIYQDVGGRKYNFQNEVILRKSLGVLMEMCEKGNVYTIKP